MLGYIVVNCSNSVVFLDGDDDFKEQLQKMLEKQIRAPSLDKASTSSGIGTDSMEESELTINRRKKPGTTFDSTEIAHILMPLIAFYRSMSEAKNDEVSRISSPLGEISFRKLYDSHLILTFAKTGKRRRELLEAVEHTMSSAFGPLISFCNSNLTTVKKPKEIMSNIISDLGNSKSKSYIDIKRMIFYSQKVSKLQEFVQKVSTQLSVFVGNNRCFLVCHGSIVATYNSTDNTDNVLKGLNVSDLSTIIGNATAGDTEDKIDQFWLRSANGSIPYYINAISFNMIKHLKLVCIVETSENILIRYLVLFSKQMEQVKTSNDLNRDFREIRKTINDLQIMLNRKKPINDNPSVAFMKNPTRASTFMRSIWQQLENEARSLNAESKPRTESRFSIASIRSAFSSMSMNSSVFSKITVSEKPISQKMDILMAYARRQTNSLIQELCSISIQNSAKTTYPLFLQCMGKIVNSKQLKILEKLDIGNEADESKLGHFLEPSKHFLEIVAYNIRFQDLHQEVSYMSEYFKGEFDELPKLQPATTFSCDTLTKSGTPFTIQSFCMEKPSKVEKFKPNSSVTVTAVFPGCINKKLAERQTKQLFDYVLLHFGMMSK